MLHIKRSSGKTYHEVLLTSFYDFLGDWTLQDGYKNKPTSPEGSELKLETPIRTLIPGLRGGLSFKLDMEVGLLDQFVDLGSV